MQEDKVGKILNKIKFLVKLALILSTCSSILALIVGFGGLGKTDDTGLQSLIYVDIAYKIMCSFFFLTVWCTIPSTILLFVIFIYNKINEKTNWPYLKTETILLAINILIGLIIFTVILVNLE
jgi:hypothetical protein